jgi:hypothetical protein
MKSTVVKGRYDLMDWVRWSVLLLDISAFTSLIPYPRRMSELAQRFQRTTHQGPRVSLAACLHFHLKYIELAQKRNTEVPWKTNPLVLFISPCTEHRLFNWGSNISHKKERKKEREIVVRDYGCRSKNTWRNTNMGCGYCLLLFDINIHLYWVFAPSFS